MAIFEIEIVEKRPAQGGGTQVTFCDPSQPGSLHIAVAASDSSADVKTAMEAQVALRKAAGLDYLGKSQTTGERVVIEV